MKRRYDSQEGARSTKKRVTHKMFKKWQCDFDRECQTMTWLDCEIRKDGGKMFVCAEFVDKIRGKKNFSDKWISGADSVCTSNVRDHARNDQHAHAIYVAVEETACRVFWLGSSIVCPHCKCMARHFLKMATQNQIWLATVATQTISLISKSGIV